MSHTPVGHYYVSFRADEPLEAKPAAESAIGINLGLSCFTALSDGGKLHAPRPLRRKMAQLKRAQKALSRKRKGSGNRNKARIEAARIHRKISDIRRDFLHKHSTGLVRENRTIKIEDLNVRGMTGLHSLAGAIGDSGLSEFSRQLEYKTKRHGRVPIRIGRWRPSSKLCSTCGAAINILAVGLADIENACGGSVRLAPVKTGLGNRLRSKNRFERCVQHDCSESPGFSRRECQE